VELKQNSTLLMWPKNEKASSSWLSHD